MTTIFNFNNDDDDDMPNKINIDDLYEKKRESDLHTLNTFRKILNRVHTKIKNTTRINKNNQHCWYVVPEIIIGVPRYNLANCIAFIVNELRDNGFGVTYTHPNLIFISWKHWVPRYVRDEIKKKTGLQVNSYGEVTGGENKNQSSKIATPFKNINKPSSQTQETKEINSNVNKSIYNLDFLNKFKG